MKPNPSKRISKDQPDTLVYQIEQNLYINLTDRCTLSCCFCPKHNNSTEVDQYQLSLSKRPDAEKIIELIGDPTAYKEVVFCGYGESTLRLKALLQIAHAIKKAGGRTRINTDGLGNLFHKRNILPELASCIDALSISLNAQDEETYNRYCQPSLPNSYEAVKAFIKLAPAYIKDVTASAIDGLEGVDIQACEEIAKRSGVKFRARPLDLVG